MTIIRRNPFARAEIHRDVVKTTGKVTCRWCGQKRKSNNLFAYRVETDGGKSHTCHGLFCRNSCFDAYHDSPLKE